MWTYRNPYRPSEISQDYLENRGRVALSRAFNLGRVVVFAGSGISSAYGAPSWDSLVELAKEEALKCYDSKKLEGSKISPLAEHYAEDLDSIDFETSEGKKQALQFSELLVEELGEPYLVKEKLAIAVAKRTESRDQGRSFESFTPSDIPCLQGSMGDEDHKLSRKSDPIDQLINALGVLRFVTLNYDVEIERRIQANFRITSHKGEKSDFAVLCDAGIEKDKEGTDEETSSLSEKVRKLPDTTVFKDATARPITSISLNANNIGSLVSFALHPGQFQIQVAHLHGRYDKFWDIVLSERDYDRIYHMGGVLQNTFEEGLMTLAAGNDLLFVGVGLNEPEMLRPLKQLLSEDTRPDFAKKHAYAMFPRNVSLSDKFFSTKFKTIEEAQEKFLNDQLAFSFWVEGEGNGSGRAADLAKDQNKARLNYTKYRIYCLFYGREAYRTVMLACKLIKKLATLDWETFDSDVKLLPFDGAIEALISKIHDISPKDPTCGWEEGKGLFTIAEFAVLTTLLARLKLTSAEPAPDKDEAGAIEKLCDEFSSEATSRALHREMARLRENQNDWLRDINTKPEPRSAEYARSYARGDNDTKRHPVMARHRPDYINFSDFSDPYSDIGTLKALKAETEKVASTAAEVLSENVHPTVEIGAVVEEKYSRKPLNGADLTTNDIGSADLAACKPRDLVASPPRRIARVSLDRGQGKGSLLHILRQDHNSKTQFVLDELFNSHEIHGKDFRYHGSFLLHLSFSMEFSSVIEALEIFFRSATIGVVSDHFEDVKGALNSRTDNPNSTGSHFIDHLNRAEVITKDALSMCASKFLNDHPRASGPGRSHRIEGLRTQMQAFTDIVDLLKNKPIRVLVVMSGIDALCDSKGNAHNPMFRAFFRLLTGSAAKFKRESDFRIPMDLLLISGSSKRPVRYLSDEYSKETVHEKLQSGNQNFASYTDYVEVEAGRYIETWQPLKQLSLNQRYWHKKQAEPEWEAFYKALTINSTKKGLKYPSIHKALEDGVALSGWVFGAYRSRLRRLDATVGDFENQAHLFLEDAEAVAYLSGLRKQLDFVFDEHRRYLKVVFEAALSGSRDKAEELFPALKHFDLSEFSGDARALAELFDLIFTYVTLFPLPIEGEVLVECPEISHLLACFSGTRDSHKNPRKNLELLRNLLDYGSVNGLLVKICEKPVDPHATGGAEQSFRYTLSHQIRDFVGYRMDLHIPDQGERNYYQLSIFADQPKDLPSPNREHYRLVRELCESLIEKSRLSLWSLYQLHRYLTNDQIPVGDAKTLYNFVPPRTRDFALEEKYGLKKRLNVFADLSTTELTPDKNAQEFQLVTQRIRAVYGLLRNGFSLGAISRLPSLNDEQADQPFERFGGWLRGLTNASVAQTQWLPSLLDMYQDPQTPPSSEKTSVAQAWLWPVKPGKSELKVPHPAPVIHKPFYRDEIGWLYNERGLIHYAQGNVYDAISMFNQAISVMQHDDHQERNDPALHAAVRRVRLNLALAKIDRGRLDEAKSSLQDLILPADFSRHAGSQISWVSSAYLALIDHISGNLDTVGHRYEAAINLANERGMLRFSSVFYRHWADLLRNKQQYQRARETVENSIATARQSEQRDILNNALLARIQIELADQSIEPKGNKKQIEKIIADSRALGMPRIETEALRIYAQMILAENDRVLAGKYAAEAAAVANRSGLRLHKLSALYVYGDALIKREQFDFARNLLSQTSRESERRSYHSLMSRISEISRFIPT